MFDLMYAEFQNEEVTSEDIIDCAVDVTMDVALGTVYYDASSTIGNSYGRTILGGTLDSILDIFQGRAYFN